MSHPTVSVVVVSRGRPDALQRALMGISQLEYPAFEVIVVADQAGQDAVSSMAFADQIKLVAYEEANISAARNRGIAQAAGEIVAFIDDDAVPETGWLHHLISPFAAQEVAAAGGFVRGRNGISFQWRAQSVDPYAEALPIQIESDAPVVLTPSETRAIKTEGTNMAFRRDVIAQMGGFDPAFRYFLDETDVNLRLASAGGKTAIVPLAEVHHGFEENAQRTANRVPRDLNEIGASMAVFLRKHCPEIERNAVWKAFCREQRVRLVRHMVAGRLMPGDVGRLMRGLKKGYGAGLEREIGALQPIARAPDGFRALDVPLGPQIVISGRYWRRKAILRSAAQAAAQGKRPSVFVFSRTALFHRVRFVSDGYWLQTGGLFGRSERKQPLFRLSSFGRRLRRETKRVSAQRVLPDMGL